jgi:Ca-activated chloride channel family protein
LLLPLALLAYVAARRRAKRHAVRFTAIPALKLAAAAVPAWRKHVPAALALAAMTALVAALAKPQRTVAVPVERASIMLVTDHSRSMLAADVSPDRLRAAQRAGRSFLDEVPGKVRVGVVAYSDSPDTVHAPSTDHDSAREVIDAQVADGATATGDALQVAIDTLTQERSSGRRAPAAIVLLSDGKTTTGRDPVEVAETARRARIPIYTVSLGTSAATVPSPDFGPPLPAAPDPQTLERIAETSDGRAFTADDSGELSDIYKSLGSQLGTKTKKREVTALFAVGGMVLLAGAAATSARWLGRMP